MSFRSKLIYAACPVLFTGYAAAVEIDDEQTAPVSTSTIDSGGPGDIDITANGSVTIAAQDGVAAVTIDSDNSFTNAGSVIVSDSDDAVGVRIAPGVAGFVTNNGSIFVNEDFTRTDEDGDGDLDGPLTAGSNRVGLLLDAGGALTGDIQLGAGSLISVEGASSAGVRLSGDLDGLLETDGAITVLGADSFGVDVAGGVNGDIRLDGTVTVTGENSVGLSITGDVDGAFENESAFIVTGFESTTATDVSATNPLDADAVLNGGPAVAIGGDLANGFLNNGDVDTFVSQADLDDETRDTVDDFDANRSAGSISAVGGSPAVLVSADWGGAATEDLVIGQVVETITDELDDDGDGDFDEVIATFNFDQGFINRGLISSDGQNLGFESNALLIEGSADGAFNTVIEGGILNTGVIQALAFDANAAGVRLGSGAVIGTVTNEGSIAAGALSGDTNTADGLFIGAGSTVDQVVNSGTIDVEVQSFDGLARGVFDEGGQVSTVLNTGTIEATFRTDTPGSEADGSGAARAVDLGANTTGATLIQREGTALEDINGDGDIDGDDVGDPAIRGDILFGSGGDTFDLEFGTVSGDVDFGAGDNVFNILSDAQHTGAARFGGGSDTLSIDGGALTGDVTFDGGVNTFALLNGATFDGGVSTTGGGQVNLAVDASTLNTTSATAIAAGTATFSNGAILQIALDPALADAPARLTASESVAFTDGSQIQLVFDTLAKDPFSATLIETAAFSSDASLSALLSTDLPFIFATDLRLIENGTSSLVADFRLRTADELPLNINQASAYGAVIDAFVADDALGSALTTATTAQELTGLIDSLLPQTSNTSLRFLAAQANGSFGAISDRLDSIRDVPAEGATGVWTQEYVNYLNVDGNTEAPGFDGEGFGIAVGVDRSWLLDVIGVSLVFSSGDFEENLTVNKRLATTNVALGLYASQSIGPIDWDVAGSAARVNFDGDRELDFGSLQDLITSDRNGWAFTGSTRLSSTLRAGALYLRPAATADYITLDEDAYTETGSSGLQLNVEAASSNLFTASGTLTLGAELNRGAGFVWAPEVRAGYRTTLSSAGFKTTANFVDQANVFQLVSADDIDDAFIGGLGVRATSRFLSFKVGVDVEAGSDIFQAFGGATIRWRF
ncbi:MAG: autotransporter domain-containing protein [Pseudomonadota bacterium]